MRKILLCLCFVFAVGLLFSACGKDDKKQNPAPAPDDIQTSTDLRDGQTPISQEEQSAIDNSSDLKNPTGDLEGKTFEIFELRFGSKYIDADADTTLGPEVVENGAVYHLVFGIKDNNGNVMYKTIDAAGAEWTLEDNVAVTKDDDKGFKVKDNFYAENGNVSVRVDIDYKGLSKTFNFVLKSEKVGESPAAQTQVRDISHITVDDITIKMELVLPPETENTEWKIVGNEVHALPAAFSHDDNDRGRIYVKLNISGIRTDLNGDYYLAGNHGRYIALKGLPPNVNFSSNYELVGYEGTIDAVIYPQNSGPVVGATITNTYRVDSIQGIQFNLMKDYKVRIVSSL